MKAQLLQWKGATSSQPDEPTHKKPLKPVCLALARLRPNESTALAMKESHREVIRGKVQKQAKVANITARHWQRKKHNTQAFKPAVCHPRAARRTLRESNRGRTAQSLFYTTMPWWLALNGKKRLFRTTDWAWKGFAGIKNTMRNTPLTPQPNPQPNPQTTPPINDPPPNNNPQPFCSGLQLTGGSCNEKTKQPFPITMSQKTSETSVFGNSAASAYWKHSSCNESEPPLPNMMSQRTKNIWNQRVWQ